MSLFRRNKPAAEQPAQGATRIQPSEPPRQPVVQRRLALTTAVVVGVFAGLIYWLESRRSEPPAAVVATPQPAQAAAAGAPVKAADSKGKPTESKPDGKAVTDSKLAASRSGQKPDPHAATPPPAAAAALPEQSEDRFNFYKMLAGQTEPQPLPPAVLEAGKTAAHGKETRPPVAARPQPATTLIPPAQIPPARASQPPAAAQPAPAVASQPPRPPAAAAAPAAAPAPVAVAPAAPAPQPAPAAQPAVAPARPAATAAVVPAASVAGTARYMLQAGSYSSADQAAGVRDKIAQLGLSASVQTGQVGDKTWYRVQSGPFNEGEPLSSASQKLQAAGFKPLSLRLPQ